MRTLAAFTFLLLSILLVGGCAGGPGKRQLTYAQVQTLNPGVKLAWVEQEYPGANQSRDASGRVRQMEFNVRDPYGKGQRLFLEFNECGVCTRKIYTGAVVRPPE